MAANVLQLSNTSAACSACAKVAWAYPSIAVLHVIHNKLLSCLDLLQGYQALGSTPFRYRVAPPLLLTAHAGHPTSSRIFAEPCMLTHWCALLQPAPILQQPRPLRRPPTTPNEVAHSVHGKVVQMTQLAAAPMHDMHKFQAMLHHDATEVLCCGSHQSSHAMIVMSRNPFLRIAAFVQ